MTTEAEAVALAVIFEMEKAMASRVVADAIAQLERRPPRMTDLADRLREWARVLRAADLVPDPDDTRVPDLLDEAAAAVARLEQEATGLHEATTEAQRLYLGRRSGGA